MESCQKFFLATASAVVRESEWFRTAPPFARKGAKFRLLGVEEREFVSALGARAVRPSLIVECRCGGLTGIFSILLGELGTAHIISETTSRG